MHKATVRWLLTVFSVSLLDLSVFLLFILVEIYLATMLILFIFWRTVSPDISSASSVLCSSVT